MRIALAQINPKVGDFSGNLEKILHYYEKAKELGANLVVFPELCVCGYPPRDFLYRKEFLEEALRVLEEIVSAVGEVAAVVGCPEPNKGPGKPLFNSAYLIKDGKVILRYRKALIPYYDIYEEPRHFEAGEELGVVELFGRKVGITVCEDLWNEEGFVPNLYPCDPLKRLKELGAEVVINLSSSPFHLGKGEERRRLFSKKASFLKAYLFYCNQVGANDHLIFDGQSMVLSPEGKLLARAFEFEEDLVYYDLEKGEGIVREVSETQAASLFKALVLGIRDFFRKVGARGAVVGLSGGIDSSVVAVLAKEALGSENVVGVIMPSRYNSPESEEDARSLAKNLGIRVVRLPIEGIVEEMKRTLKEGLKEEPAGIVEENLQARVRGNLLMAVSNQYPGYLVLSTGNKSEIALGYCTLYGDTCGALSVLGDLTKDLVYELAFEINRRQRVIPERVLKKPPSAELRPNQKDEDDIPPYYLVNGVVRRYVEMGLSPQEIIRMGVPKEVVREVVERLKRSEFKRWQLPPSLRVTPQAFGYGWRYPIAHGFHMGLPRE